MTFYELYNELDKRYPKSLSCDWDNDGIMCADDISKPVKKALISLDITSDVVDYAIRKGYDTIISHHPLVFHPQKSLSSLDYTQRKLISLLKNGIRVMSFHTRLDAAQGGVNDTLASMLGASEIRIDSEETIGRIIEFEESTTLLAFAKKVKKVLSAPAVLFSGNRNVSRIYIVGGSGKDMLQRALTCGADTMLTGRASYDILTDACDMGINIVEAGHFYTENPVCETVKNIIFQIDSSIKTEHYNSNAFSVI